MKRLMMILSALLAVQIGLTGIMLFGSENQNAIYASDDLLLDLKADDFDGIEISVTDTEKLAFSKTAQGWIMPGYFGAPASGKKVQSIVDKLLALNKTWPVATTEDAAPRFKVTGDTFEYRLDFKNGDKPVKTLFLGTTPGFRKIHARLDGQNDIYAITFSAYDLEGKQEDWADKNLLAVDQDSITRFKLGELHLSKNDDQWQFEESEEGQTADSEAIKRLLARISHLTFDKILGDEMKPEYQLQNPLSEIEITLKDGSEIRYQIGKMENGENFTVKSSKQPYYFEVGKTLLEPILMTERNKLLKQPEPVSDNQTE